MMSARTTSGNSPPATPVISFWCMSLYGIVTALTLMPGLAFSKAGITSFSSVPTSGESAE